MEPETLQITLLTVRTKTFPFIRDLIDPPLCSTTAFPPESRYPLAGPIINLPGGTGRMNSD